MTVSEIKAHMAKLNLDVSQMSNARFMDQKCIPDVVCAVAECILEYDKLHPKAGFTKNDIWFSPYANDLISTSFSKPDLDDKGAKSEYDKFFGQPLRLFAYANVLSISKKGNSNFYTIANREILEFVSLREQNAFVFLNAYLEKLIDDNNLMPYFDDFFNKQDKSSLEILCDRLDHLYWDKTNVDGKYEPSRIYNKIINIFAKGKCKKGIIGGRLSENIITFSDIRYNTMNWRDKKKDRNITRQAFAKMVQNQINDSTTYLHYSIEKAKKYVRMVESDCSEVHRFFPKYSPTQAHHIFMASEFPELADCPENIICLTPNQHYKMAHPNNKTSIVDLDYQIVCLLCKLDSIEINLRNGKDDYSLAEFINVLNTGFGTDIFTLQMDYEDIKYTIIKTAYYHDYLVSKR